MKKTYLIIITWLCMCSMLLANTNDDPITGGWTQDFVGGNLSDGWVFNPDDNKVWNTNSQWTNTGVHMKYKNKDMVFFNSFNPSKGTEASLESPVFIPGRHNHTLEYLIEEYIYAANYIKPETEPKMYIEVSTDGGNIYTESTINILEQIPNHNVKPSVNGTSLDSLTFTYDLSPYIDQEIKIRFRAVSGRGGTYVFLWRVSLPDNSPTVLTELDETFENGLPENWTISSPVTGDTGLWKFHTPENPGAWVSGLQGRETPDKTFAFFETWTGSQRKEGYLETPLFMPTGNKWLLSFEAGKILRGLTYSDVTLFVEVSEDNGETYLPSEDNLAAGLNLQQTAPTEMSIFHMDLSDYLDKPIKLRFRASRPVNGGAYLLLDNVKLQDGPEKPELLLGSVKADYTQIPISHIEVVNYNFSIENKGFRVKEDDAEIKVTTSPGTYTRQEGIPTLYYLQKHNMNISNIPAEGTGTMSVTFTAEVKDGSAPSSESVSTDIIVTEKTFALDSGVMAGTQGVGSQSAGDSFGNIFELAKEDIIGSISVGWGETTTPLTFKFKIFKINEDNTVEEVYVSEDLERPATTKEDVGKLIEYKLEEVQKLEKGQYIFTVNQLDAAIIGLGTDGVEGSPLVIVWPDLTVSVEREFGYALLRPNLASFEVRELTPADEAIDVDPESEVSIKFSLPVTGNLNGITINGEAATASVSDNSVIIEHDKFEFDKLYTVVVPKGAIDGYDEAITWSFTTRKGIDVVNQTPKDGSKNVKINADINAEFNFDIEIIAQNVTINNTKVNTEASGKRLIISHEDFEYDTEYTIIIPKGTLKELDKEIKWSFTTELAPIQFVVTTPEDGAKDIDIESEVSAEFSREITIISQNVTINGEKVQAFTNGSKLIVNHDKFIYNENYTVVIPRGTIKDFDEEVKWNFKTKEGGSIGSSESGGIKIYPTITKGAVSIITEGNATIKVTDISGRTVAQYESRDKNEIYLEDTNGIYIITVESENDGKVYKQKIVLQK